MAVMVNLNGDSAVIIHQDGSPTPPDSNGRSFVLD
jgi:hypothetical protein